MFGAYRLGGYIALCDACSQRRLRVELVAGDVLYRKSSDELVRWRVVRELQITSAGTVIATERMNGLRDLDRAALAIRPQFP